VDIDALAAGGWDDAGIREMTRLIAFYNFSGRLEAASGLPRDEPDARGIDRVLGR
jgi:alkylhydroperoxidase family enzyme